MSTPEKTTLLPCPFCGGDDLARVHSPHYSGERVECKACGCIGPFAGSANGLVAWNTRTGAPARAQHTEAEYLRSMAREYNATANGRMLSAFEIEVFRTLAKLLAK